MNEIALDQVSAGQFTELVRTKFQVLVQPSVAVDLELAAVTAAGPQSVSPGGAKFESFSLLFEGPASQPLSQRTYRFTHERLGAFDLFIVPISAERDARQYEAVFNRRVAQK